MNNLKIFKNKNFKRNYECTNVQFIKSEHKPEGECWEECDISELEQSKAKQLWIENGKTLYGYL